MPTINIYSVSSWDVPCGNMSLLTSLTASTWKKKIKYYESQSALWCILAYSRNWRKLMKWLVSGLTTLLSRSSNNGGRLHISGMYLIGMPSQDGRKDQYDRNAKVVCSSCVKVLIDTGSFATNRWERLLVICWWPWNFWCDDQGAVSIAFRWKCTIFRNLPRRRLWKLILYGSLAHLFHTVMLPKCRTWSITRCIKEAPRRLGRLLQ